MIDLKKITATATVICNRCMDEIYKGDSCVFVEYAHMTRVMCVECAKAMLIEEIERLKFHLEKL